MRIFACLSLLAFGGGAAAQTSVDYDANDNNLIDVRTRAQLQAITHDLNGNGDATAAAYVSAFPNRMSGMGCPGTCTGYELLNDIDLSGGDWTPIGGVDRRELTPSNITLDEYAPPANIIYSGTFEGNGYVISGMRVDSGDAVSNSVGLFNALDTGGIIRNVGLIDVSVVTTKSESHFAGALVGFNRGTVAASYVVGGVVSGDQFAGGLVGANYGAIIASYANVRVKANFRNAGLVAYIAMGRVQASYSLNGDFGSCRDGLIGAVEYGERDVTIESSYFAGDGSECSGGDNVPMLDRIRRMLRDMHRPTAATGIFENWVGLNVDNVASTVTGVLTMNDDNPWDFGTSDEYPALRGVSPRFPDGNTTAIEIQRQRHPGPQPASLVLLSGPSAPAEEGSTAEYVLELDGDNTGTVTVVWEIESLGNGDGFADSADFGAIRGTETLDRVGRRVFGVVIRDDGVAEPEESFRVRLIQVLGDPVLRLSQASSAVVNTIAMTAESASLAAPRGPVAEGSTATYMVELDGSNPRVVTMNWALALTGVGTGHAALADFVGATGGTVLIPAGSRSASFGVMTRADDAARERVETFRVRVSNLRGGAPGLRLSASSAVVSAIAPQGENYDVDGDGLIDVATLPQLNALRYDASGAGIAGVPVADAPAYEQAFAFFDPNLTCPDGCRGYELLNDLDFNTGQATTRSDDLYWNGGAGWEPVDYGGTFDGNGRVLSNLYLDDTGTGNVNRGLFGALTEGGVIRGVGLVDATIESRMASQTGALAGFTAAGTTITSSYAVGGSVVAAARTGGLVGFHTGALAACYAAVVVTGTTVGSLAGSIGGTGSVIASYGVGRVRTGLSDTARFGGLAGSRDEGCTDCTVVNSYYDTESTGVAHADRGTRRGVSKTTSNLQTPVGYDDAAGNGGQAIYAAWNVDVSGDGVADDPWDFGTPLDYPVLRGAVTANVVRQFALQPPIALTVTLTGAAAVLEGVTAEYTVRAPVALHHAATAHWSVVATSGAGMAAIGDFGDGAGTRLTRFPTGTAVIAAGGSRATFSVYPFDDQDTEPAERFSVRVDRVEDTGGRVIWSTGNSAVVASAIELSDGTDYDVDGNGLIDVATVDQLAAIRYDLGGRGLAGATSRTAYLAAFALFDAARTCHDSGGCVGYELSNDLDLSGEDWTPLGGGVGTLAADDYYTAVFEGNGYVISNLRVVRSGRLSHTGLFGAVSASGTVRNVGLRNVDISVGDHSTYIGALVGRNEGTVAASYVQGTTVSGVWAVGGLTGGNFGRLVASYANVRVHAGGANAGGLTGEAGGASVVSASYTIGLTTGGGSVGGLIGQRRTTGAAVQSSYFDGERGGSSGPSDCCGTNVLNPDDTSKTSAALTTPTAAAGIYAGWDRLNVNGVDENNDGDYNDDAPWDFGTFLDYPVLRGADVAVARRQFLLQDPVTLAVTLTGAATVFEGEAAEYTVRAPVTLHQAATAHWSVFTTTATGMAAVEDFGDGAGMRLTRFPTGTAVIAAGASRTTFPVHIFDDGDFEPAERFSVRVDRVEDAGGRVTWSTGNSSVFVSAIELSDGTNYNVDVDGLIDVTTAEQLAALSYDLNGRGLAGVSAANRAAYLAAFDAFDAAQTCPSTCTGYELLNDIRLSSTRNWTLIGGGDVTAVIGDSGDPPFDIRYEATFEGNGHVIRGLRFRIGEGNWFQVGLFRALGVRGVIRNVGLTEVDIESRNTGLGTNVGSLVGHNSGKVATSYARGRVAIDFASGGLVGANAGEIIASYADVVVNPYDSPGGGLVGLLRSGGSIRASYASGPVYPQTRYLQGLGDNTYGGLVGETTGQITNSYSSRELSELPEWIEAEPPGSSRQAWELYTPTSAVGIFAEWDNLNVDDTTGTVMGVVTTNDDSPWDFGNAFQYPVLRHGRSAAAVQAQQSSQTLLLRPTLRGDAMVSEGDRARYTVSLEQALPPSGLPSGVSASWSWSAGGRAVGGGDFDGTTRGRVVIAPGRNSASFSLAVAADRVSELDETFTVSLSDAALSGDVGSTSLGVASAVRTTIAANELGQVTVVAESETVAEGATATFTLRLDGGGDGDVFVVFQIVAASGGLTPADLERVTWVDREGPESAQLDSLTGSASTDTVVLRMAGIATVTVAVAADNVPGEGAERFGLRLIQCGLCGRTRPVEIGVPSSAQVTISRTPLTVSAQVYLQGAYSSETSDMKTTLAPRLPRRQPYGVAPWNYLADTSVPPVAGRDGLRGVTSTAVDWVLVELRASTPGAGAGAVLPTTGGFAAGLLLSDGRIAGINEGATTVSEALLLDGVPVAAEFAQGADIYVLVHHRNHLAVMSAQPVAFDAAGCGGYCVDFRNVPSYQGCAQLRRAGEGYMMIAGDVNRSGVVSWGDDSLRLEESYAVDADLDFSGRLSRADTRLILANHLLSSECTP